MQEKPGGSLISELQNNYLTVLSQLMAGWILLESLTLTSIGVRHVRGYSDKLCLLFGLSNCAFGGVFVR